MNTPSFLAGLCLGAGSTALFAGQADWWFWLAGGVVFTIVAAVTDFRAWKRQHQEKKP